MLAQVLAASLLGAAGTAPAQPRIFAPGVISTGAPDIAPTFVAGGGSLYFSRRLGSGRWSIMRSSYRGKAWTAPVIASFSGQWNDLEAAAAPSGRYLIFASDRPEPGKTAPLTAHYYGHDQVGGALWRIELTGTAAGSLRRLPDSVNAGSSVWTPSIAANGDLAFMRTDVESGRFRIFLARSHGAAYGAVRPLAFSTGTANDVDPALDPGERFLIFSSDRDTPGREGAPGPEHLYIAWSPLSTHPVVCPLRFPGWSDPQVSEVEPRLSPDETRLYFASRHPDHAPGNPARGPWDDGKANIWSIRFSAKRSRPISHGAGTVAPREPFCSEPRPR